jgi:hypothetical protein
MMARFLSGADLPAAREGQAMLRHRIAQIEAAGRLAIASEAAVQVVWASVNSAAMLFLSATLQPGVGMGTPDPAIVAGLRDAAVQAICKPVSPE